MHSASTAYIHIYEVVLIEKIVVNYSMTIHIYRPVVSTYRSTAYYKNYTHV